jgi:CheY-like chemotaxis protein
MREPSHPNPQSPYDCVRILVAEADAYHRRVLRVLLASPGISAIEVEDGQSAIDLLTLRSFDLILLSLDLPIMSGADVVRWVRRSQTPWSDIPILGLVNDAQRDGLGRVISSGLTDWTPKPISRQHLSEKIIGLMPNLAGTGL